MEFIVRGEGELDFDFKDDFTWDQIVSKYDFISCTTQDEIFRLKIHEVELSFSFEFSFLQVIIETKEISLERATQIQNIFSEVLNNANEANYQYMNIEA